MDIRNMFRLDGKNAIVIGGAGGIGEGARAGDQTGKEICTRDYVGSWFTWVLRLKRA